MTTGPGQPATVVIITHNRREELLCTLRHMTTVAFCDDDIRWQAGSLTPELRHSPLPGPPGSPARRCSACSPGPACSGWRRSARPTGSHRRCGSEGRRSCWPSIWRPAAGGCVAKVPSAALLLEVPLPPDTEEDRGSTPPAPTTVGLTRPFCIRARPIGAGISGQGRVQRSGERFAAIQGVLNAPQCQWPGSLSRSSWASSTREVRPSLA
jgi:hypothetical protein